MTVKYHRRKDLDAETRMEIAMKAYLSQGIMEQKFV